MGASGSPSPKTVLSRVRERPQRVQPFTCVASSSASARIFSARERTGPSSGASIRGSAVLIGGATGGDEGVLSLLSQAEARDGAAPAGRDAGGGAGRAPGGGGAARGGVG